MSPSLFCVTREVGESGTTCRRQQGRPHYCVTPRNTIQDNRLGNKQPYLLSHHFLSPRISSDIKKSSVLHVAWKASEERTFRGNL